jgi:fido (protein-threonine AMPylation protein)
MLLNQTFKLTPKIQSLLNTLEGQKLAFGLIPVKPELVLNLRRQSLLHSALYSAKIEGIGQDSQFGKLALQNLERTYVWLYHQKIDFPIDQPFLRTLHAKSYQDLGGDAGHFRTEQSAIFNSAGIAVYLTPPPQEIPALLEEWQLQTYDLCKILISHYQFEKIHPFLDGNGRVGRLILTQQLRRLAYDFGGLLVIEEAINNTRDDYYYHLQNESKDITGFIEYFLTLLTDQSPKVLAQISRPPEPSIASSLLPRRQELLHIIRDHSPCSFDFLHRRFVAIPPSTLRFDLLSLQKSGLIRKLGVTNGVLYAHT